MSGVEDWAGREAPAPGESAAEGVHKMHDDMAVSSQEKETCVVDIELLLTLQHSQELLLHSQELLLEMIADLYEVAQALGPKVGVNLMPASTVRAWQHTRSSAGTVKRGRS